VQVVEVRREAKSLDGTIDILLDMSSGIGDGAIAKDVKAAFRSN
jgi:hypothetical protein